MKSFFRLVALALALISGPALAQTSMSRASLISDAQNYIKANGVGAITGPILQLRLTNMDASMRTLTDDPISATISTAIAANECAANGLVIIAYTNAQMNSIASTAAGCIERVGYASLGDAPPAFYTPNATCPYNGGTADGGSCVATSDGKFWLLQNQPVLDSSEWGTNPANSDNGPNLQYMFNYAAVRNGQPMFTTGTGLYTLASTFTCANASNWTWKGTGDGTQFYRTANYGSTMKCGDASHFPSNIRVADMFMRHDITMSQPAVPSSFTNPTTNSAHFDFINITHFVFDHVTAWDLNYDFRIIQCIDGTWIDPHTSGYWDGTNNQTVADFFFDGADGTGLGHPQIMKIHDAQAQGYNRPFAQTFTSGALSNAVGSGSYNQELSAFDHIMVRSMEGLTIDGGYGYSGAYNSSVHLQPQGVAGKPITQIQLNHLWLDGAGTADVLIENVAQTVCSNPNVSASNVKIDGGIINGELSSYYAIQVPNYTCPSVNGLHIIDVLAIATIKGGYYLGGVNGGNISGGSVQNYNVFGVYGNDPAAASAVYVFGHTNNFDINGIKVGGDNTYTHNANNVVGNASVYGGGSGYVGASGTLTWSGGGCSTNPVLNVTASGGVITGVSSIANGGVCAPWPTISSPNWTPGGGLSAGSGVLIALLPAFSYSNQSMFGVTLTGGLVGVTRENISNGGYYQDPYSQQLVCSLGTGTPLYSSGADNRHGIVTTLSSSGAVTSGSCTFNGALMSDSLANCHSTDAVTSGGTPVASQIYNPNALGFNIRFASSIGGGGSFSFICDASN